MTTASLLWLTVIFAVSAAWQFFRGGGTLIVASALLSGVCLSAAVVNLLAG
jgi:hypothetical protein